MAYSGDRWKCCRSYSLRVLLVFVIICCFVNLSSSQSLLSLLFGRFSSSNNNNNNNYYRTTRAPYRFNAFQASTPTRSPYYGDNSRQPVYSRFQQPAQQVPVERQRASDPIVTDGSKLINIRSAIPAADNFRLNENLPLTFPIIPPTAATKDKALTATLVRRAQEAKNIKSGIDSPVGSPNQVELQEASGKELFAPRFQLTRNVVDTPLVDDALSDIPPLPQIDYDDENDNEFNTVVLDTSMNNGRPSGASSQVVVSTTTTTSAPVTTTRRTTTTTTPTTTTTRRTTTTPPTTTTTTRRTTTTLRTTTQRPTTTPRAVASNDAPIKIPAAVATASEELRDLPPLPDFGDTDYDDLTDGNNGPGISSPNVEPKLPVVTSTTVKPTTTTTFAPPENVDSDSDDLAPILIDVDYKDGEDFSPPISSSKAPVTSAPSVTTPRPVTPAAATIDIAGDLPPLPPGGDEDDEEIGPAPGSIVRDPTTSTTSRPFETSTTARPVAPVQSGPPLPVPNVQSNDEDNFDDLAPVPISAEEDDDDSSPPAQFPVVISTSTTTTTTTTTNRPPTTTTQSFTAARPTFPPAVPTSFVPAPIRPAVPSTEFPRLTNNVQTFAPARPNIPPAAPPAQRPINTSPINTSPINTRPDSFFPQVQQSRPPVQINRLPQQTTVNVSRGYFPGFDSVRGVLESVFSSLRNGDAGFTLPHVFHLNIGTINVNSGPGTQTIYNSGSDGSEPLRILRKPIIEESFSQPSAGTTSFNSLPVQESPLTVGETSNFEGQTFEASSESPQLGSELNNDDRKSSQASIPSGPPLPLPPTEQQDEYSDLPPSPTFTGSRSFKVNLDGESESAPLKKPDKNVNLGMPPLPIFSEDDQESEFAINTRANIG